MCSKIEDGVTQNVITEVVDEVKNEVAEDSSKNQWNSLKTVMKERVVKAMIR